MGDLLGGDLSGKIAVITGASRGLGRAMALALSAQGARVALVARDVARLDAVRAEIGDSAAVFTGDVSVEEDVVRIEREVAARLGTVQILINNAGINLRKPLVEFTLEEWRGVIDASLTGAFLMCRAFVPHMKGTGWGRIINLTSIMSHVSIPGRTAYSAAKTGLLGMTRALALELAGEGITVNGISPGPFATEMNTQFLTNAEAGAQLMANMPVGKWGKPEDIGALACYLCSDAAGLITGTDIVIDGGWTAR